MAWTQEARNKALETQRKNREKKQALLSGGSSVTATVPSLGDASGTVAVGGDEGLHVSVKADGLKPQSKPSLRERLGLGGSTKIAAPAPTRRKSSGKRADKPNLIITLLPTILASLIATYARDRIPEEYQACAPTQQEVQQIIGPLMDILGRRVEVAAEVSQDILDITNSLICGLAYGARAYVTYVDIKKHQEQPNYAKAARIEHERRDYAEIESDPETTLPRGLRAYQATNNGASNPTSGVNGSRPYESINGVNSNDTHIDDDATELRNQEAALIADMFKRDRAGRVQLGLLPRTV